MADDAVIKIAKGYSNAHSQQGHIPGQLPEVTVLARTVIAQAEELLAARADTAFTKAARVKELMYVQEALRETRELATRGDRQAIIENVIAWAGNRAGANLAAEATAVARAEGEKKTNYPHASSCELPECEHRICICGHAECDHADENVQPNCAECLCNGFRAEGEKR